MKKDFKLLPLYLKKLLSDFDELWQNIVYNDKRKAKFDSQKIWSKGKVTRVK